MLKFMCGLVSGQSEAFHQPYPSGSNGWIQLEILCVCACVSMSLVSCGGTIRLRVLLSLK